MNPLTSRPDASIVNKSTTPLPLIFMGWILLQNVGCATINPLDTGDIDTGELVANLVCPQNMVPVGNNLYAPNFCIDAYEVTVIGDLGDADQHSSTSTAPYATANSLPGRTPTTLVSFGQAKAICEQTPVVDWDGQTQGYKRLPLHSEWEDAADGTIGSGGWDYPYGDTWIDHACAMPLEDGEVVLDTLQATGEFEQCISSFGVYDALGNAWEWTDSGIQLDIDAWFNGVKNTGVAIEVGTDDTLIVNETTTKRLSLRMQGLVERTLKVSDDGVLMVAATAFDSLAYGIQFKGYLVWDDGTSEGLNLPIWFDIPPMESSTDTPMTTTDEPVLVLWASDGATIPDKRGCGYYAGSAEGCRLDSRGLGHPHDFHGLISFRCISNPL